MSEVEFLTMPLPYVYGEPSLTGVIRQNIEDFVVEEDLGFEPDGEGHHVLLWIEKRDNNTQWVIKQLARYADLPKMEIGYAGLKDRHAITRQWFSVHMAGRDIDWQGFNADQWQILRIARHQRKLRPGFLRGNKFKIVVRDICGDSTTLEERLSTIKQRGFVNYFGEQRFGFDNLQRAYDWLCGELKVKKKQEKSILLSSLRSGIFNQVVAERVRQGHWDSMITGDVMMLAGSHSVFAAGEITEELVSRLQLRDILTTAPLYGTGVPLTSANALAIENAVHEKLPILCEKLSGAGLNAQRRSMIVMPENLQWQFNAKEKILTLEFALTSGAYATCLLREIVRVEDARGGD